jgi:hypothetical protein
VRDAVVEPRGERHRVVAGASLARVWAHNLCVCVCVCVCVGGGEAHGSAQGVEWCCGVLWTAEVMRCSAPP